MARTPPPDPKLVALAASGTVNPHAQEVKDSVFIDSDFFDARDLVQVRYEMLRRVRTDGQSIAEVAARFGVSRPTFYKAQADFEPRWLAGAAAGQAGAARTAQDHRRRRGLHRSGDCRRGRFGCSGAGRENRAALRRGRTSAYRGARTGTAQKKTPANRAAVTSANTLTERYEALRQDVAELSGRGRSLSGRALLMFKGMAAWMRGVRRCRPESTRTARATEIALPTGMEQNLINIVVTMTLATAQESRP